MKSLHAPHILTLLRNAVEAVPSAPCITDLRTRQTWTYEDMWHCTLHLTDLLTQQGVSTGDHIALLTRNHPVFFPLLFACAMKGAALVPINTDTLRTEIHTIVTDADVTLMLRDETYSPPDEGGLSVTWRTDREPPPAPALPADFPEDVLMIYTSGTSGNATGVMLTHRNLVCMANTFGSFYHLRPHQRFLSMLPFSPMHAPLITGLACIGAHAHVYLTDPDGLTNAHSIFAMVEDHGIHVLSFTPSIMASLLQLHPEGTRRDISSLEFCFCGTAALGETLWRQFEQLFKVPVYQGYGMAETTTWATMTPPDARKRYDTVGVPVGCDIRIAGDTTGEVLIKGDRVMRGYYHKKKLTRHRLQDGWFHSGDMGCLDQENQLIILGRMQESITRRGVHIHPESIDACLRQSASVVDACTVGVPDALVGEKVVTVCVLSHGTVEDVHAELQRRLSPSLHPNAIYEIHALPRNAVGQVLVAKVRDIVSGHATTRFIHTFDRYKFRRAPSERMDDIRAIIQAAILAGVPIAFVGYWGVGHRTDPAEPEYQALARLGELRKAMHAVLDHPPAHIMLLLADVHARCNRIGEPQIAQYLQQIAALAATQGLHTMWLSQLWKAAGCSARDVEKLASDPEVLQAWQAFPLREAFLRQAAHRCGSPDQVEAYALRYYCTGMIDKPLLTAALKGSIFFTYNAPKFRMILPELPLVYWHSTKPGTAAKPWFL